MTHPELLTNVLPKPKGLPSKNLVKIFGGMVLMLLVLGMVISYEQESKPAADDFARVAASTLTSVERSRVQGQWTSVRHAFALEMGSWPGGAASQLQCQRRHAKSQ